MAEIRRVVRDTDAVAPSVLWLRDMLERGLPGGAVEIRIGRETRNSEQNARFHAMCGDFARSGVEWFGKRRSLDEWKVLLVSAHAVATKKPGEVVPGLEGELVAIRESTARMSKQRIGSLIDYAQAMADQLGVTLRDPAPAQYQQYREAQA